MTATSVRWGDDEIETLCAKSKKSASEAPTRPNLQARAPRLPKNKMQHLEHPFFWRHMSHRQQEVFETVGDGIIALI